ncbi:MAG TPA: zinc-binding dehydrogenase [Thermoanaerobaculia bacterium]
MVKRVQVIGSVLRARPAAEKAALVQSFLARFGADLNAGRIKPVIHAVLPMERAADAHRAVARSEHFGKVVLRVGSGER